MSKSQIVQYLREAHIDFAATLPDSRIHNLISAIEAHPEITHVPVAKEEEGVGLCAGAYLVGKRPAIVMQNAGLLNCCNVLTTLNNLYDIPLLLLISYRGHVDEDSFYHTPLGTVTEPVLTALGIKYTVVRRAEDLREDLINAAGLAMAAERPVALLLTKHSLKEDA